MSPPDGCCGDNTDDERLFSDLFHLLLSMNAPEKRLPVAIRVSETAGRHGS
jgi:hypothetical protein